ncbi:MAG: GFA family protein [Cyanobacteria bacterium P01_F01_bin.86]
MDRERIDGQCLCQSIQFQIKEAPLWIGHCHCQSCRRNTGSAVATFVGVSAQAIKFVCGERSFYESSPGVRRGFCAACGTPLTYEADRFPNEVHIYLGTLNRPEEFSPQFHVYCAERIAWFEIKDDLPKYLGTYKSELA